MTKAKKKFSLTKSQTPINVINGDGQTVTQTTEEAVMKRKKELVKNFTENVYAKYQGQGKDKRWCTYIPDETKPNGRRKVVRTNEEDLDDVIVEYCESQTYGKTVGELYREYYDTRQAIGKLRGATRIAYDSYFKKWYVNTGFANERISKYTAKDIRLFMKNTFINAGGMTSKQYSKFKTPLKGILEQAYDYNLIDYTFKNVSDPITIADFKKRAKDPTKEVFNHEELEILFNYLLENKDNIVNSCILLLFISGLRVGEAVTLKYSDIDYKKCEIKVTRTETRDYDKKGKVKIIVGDDTKTEAGSRIVPISEEYRPFLKSLYLMSAFDEYVFMYRDGQYKGQRIKTSGVRRKLERVCEKLGLEYKTPHKCRKTFASLLDEAQVDPKLIAKWLGHTNPQTSYNFYEFNLSTSEEERRLANKAVNFGSYG